jgi:hypothetical protein
MKRQHKPRIKCIEIATREWKHGVIEPMITFERWDGYKGLAPKHFMYRTFFHPTAASLTRCRRAQDSMVSQIPEVPA